MNTKKIFSLNGLRTALMIAGLALYITSCGPAVYEPDDISTLPSRSIPRGGNDGTVTTQPTYKGPYAECNKFSDSATGVSGLLSTYYDPSTRTFIPNVLSLDLSDVPSTLLSTDTYYINIFKWSEDIPGQRVTNDRHTKMVFLLKGVGGYIVNNNKPITALSRPNIQTVIHDANLGDSGVDVDNFFDKVLVLLLEMEIQYDAIQVVFYNGNTSLGYFDVLAPAFSANPNTYAANHPATSLQSLHPFNYLASSGASDQEFYNYSMEMCQEIYAKLGKTSDRLPASKDSTSDPNFFIRLWAHIKAFWNKLF